MSDYFREAFGSQGIQGESLSLDGGPAFPIKEHLDSDWSGMTMRDYFAAKAMQGHLSYGKCADMSTEGVAKHAYAYADAMLKARGN
ncbi:hypothetical protein [Pseudomonas sp.]|uniref:hypothetical protein n=1 Tax=Pseudomonas sp. TaxID=306 RepID=UPI0025889D70|nr:hypothetical protein [Pseudomonas sp.]